MRDSSDVLADLKQDPSFNTDEYPVVNGDTAINFIHLAESEQGEVLIYVYQPHQTPAKYRASSINICIPTDNTLDIKNYYLDLVDYDGVFQKYVVRDFAALTKNERVYEVVSIYRMFDATVDQGLGDDNDNTIQEVVYPVGKSFKFTDTPNGMTTNVSDLQYITVTDKYVGFMRYPAGSLFFTELSLDVHYVAFSTNYLMENLLEADVFYVKQRYEKTGVAGKETYGEKTPEYSYLNVKEQLVYDNGAWWSKDYSWNTIEKPDAFLASSEGKTLYKKGVFDTYMISTVDEEARKHITDSEWVLRFAQTEYLESDGGVQVPYTDYQGYIVGEVSILRLAFETDGQYYNLPVIDNKQSGSLTPSNKIEYEVQASEWWQKIMMILCLILLVTLLTAFAAPVGAFLKVIINGFTFLFKMLLRLLSLPLKLLRTLFKGSKSRR